MVLSNIEIALVQQLLLDASVMHNKLVMSVVYTVAFSGPTAAMSKTCWLTTKVRSDA